jgi:hypothetical protein
MNLFTEYPNRRDALLAGLIPCLLLLPFLNKAWNIDDTVYLRVAEQIQQSPLDFYGFQMNWQREPQWVYDFNQNPPGISYYIAAVAAVFGFNEIPLHLSFLMPTFLAGVGAYRPPPVRSAGGLADARVSGFELQHHVRAVRRRILHLGVGALGGRHRYGIAA